MQVDVKKKTKTERILKFTLIVAGAAFIGYSIKAGSVLISFAVSFFNPEAAKNIYKGLNLSAIREFSIGYYALAVFFVFTVYVLQSSVWLLMVKILSKIKLSNPFTLDIATRMEQMSYVLASIGSISILANAYSDWLTRKTGESFMTWNTQEFVFMALLVFIISQIFKRGVEIQSENELTV